MLIQHIVLLEPSTLCKTRLLKPFDTLSTQPYTAPSNRYNPKPYKAQRTPCLKPYDTPNKALAQPCPKP